MKPGRLVLAIVLLACCLGLMLSLVAHAQAVPYGPPKDVVDGAWSGLLAVPGLLVGLLAGAAAMQLYNGVTVRQLKEIETTHAAQLQQLQVDHAARLELVQREAAERYTKIDVDVKALRSDIDRIDQSQRALSDHVMMLVRANREVPPAVADVAGKLDSAAKRLDEIEAMLERDRNATGG